MRITQLSKELPAHGKESELGHYSYDLRIKVSHTLGVAHIGVVGTPTHTVHSTIQCMDMSGRGREREKEGGEKGRQRLRPIN